MDMAFVMILLALTITFVVGMVEGIDILMASAGTGFFCIWFMNKHYYSNNK